MTKKLLDKMNEIIDGCMGEEKAACVSTCPMHTDVKKYIQLIRDDKGTEAIKTIREKLFLPASLGRICAHPCEGECKWNEAKSPMSIASLKRYAADNFDSEEIWDMSIDTELNNHKVAVIGSGPSGMQAALDLRKRGADVTVFEKMPERGGMMRYGIPEYRLPAKVLEQEIKYLDLLGVNFNLGCEIGKDVSFDSLLDNYDAVIAAVGKQNGRVDRSLENHTANGIYSAAGFLKSAALNPDTLSIGSTALVVGGGDVAMDCARTARRIKNVEKVYSVCLENSFDNMFASNHEISGAISEGIKFNHGRAIKSIHTDESGNVCGVTLKKCLSLFDENGNFAPAYDEEETYDLKTDCIIFAIGQGVDSSFSDNLLKQRPNSTFECDKNTLQSVSNEKVFIAGDASGESVIVIQSMATGRRAAESVARFLKSENLVEGRTLEDTSSFKTKLDLPVDWSDIEYKRLGMEELDPESRVQSFDEVALGFTKEEAIKEASRCKQCECRKCMKECIMLNDFTNSPKALFEKYIAEGFENMDKMIAFSCNECSQCTINCPKDFDLRSIFKDLKREYSKKNNGLTPIESLIESDLTQEKESSEEYCISVSGGAKTPAKKKTKYVFAPGCSISAYTPSGMENILKHLKDSLGNENVGALLQCCGKVTDFIGEEEKFKERNKIAIDKLDEMGAEVIITVCPSCYKIYEKTAKNQKVISYWDLMKNLIGIPEEQKNIGVNSDVTFNIHDSCVTRDVESHHESVRWILDELGYNWEEIEKSKTDTRCCGVGGMVCNSNPELFKKVYERRASDFNQHNIVTYCGSCRGTMETAGKDSVHILDLLFGEKYTKSKEKKRAFISTDEMWERRLETKKRFADFK